MGGYYYWGIYFYFVYRKAKHTLYEKVFEIINNI
ncbi:hypothetical protein Xmau_01598 [Xenorhabdus mauleonii]|uniref:Uncharacterized protein n=1 Tax=Xenorhabdus mauleonii TaxID=351675 RepID=A0A1I3P8L2_9GAMM|nr:hypothetical protein Xmau_01598 [Xenorhabdus mauleonii]SFJ17772.1 hypothetical protein SAMN05421680_10663 [Xenorhabdus mauleonii]